MALTRRQFHKWGLSALSLTACGRGEMSGERGGIPSEVSLHGAGATFPYPLFSKWAARYHELHPRVKVNYQSIGSGGGILQIAKGTVDFGATEIPFPQDRQEGGSVLHLPVTIGAVAVAYQLPGVRELRLEPDVLAEIFMGKIKKWNHRRIRKTNPNSDLPDQAISVVHRADGSGTTAVFTEYLSEVSEDWKVSHGSGPSVKWPVGLGAKGNEGVTGQLTKTPGCIGYVELAYARQSGLNVAQIENQRGEFVSPNIESLSAAARSRGLPASRHVSLVDSEGSQAYPISSYSYILVREEMKESAKAKALANFLWWTIHEGQNFASDLHYAPLPPKARKEVEAGLRMLKTGGRPVLSTQPVEQR